MKVTRKGKYGYLTITGDDGKVFVISDMHLGHANVIKYCSRPFSDVVEMNKTLIANWNAVVGENDIVINIGDFIWRGGIWDKILEKLNGKQILVLGNHDRRSDAEKAEKQTDKLLFVGDMIEIRYNNNRFFVCHYPLANWSASYYDMYHLYGHIHEKSFDVGSPKKYNCCVELNNYTPQLLMDVKERIDEKCRILREEKHQVESVSSSETTIITGKDLAALTSCSLRAAYTIMKEIKDKYHIKKVTHSHVKKYLVIP